MRIRIISAVSALIMLTASLFSQTLDNNGGSLYSIFGVGDLNYSTSARTDAMGIMGIALYGGYSNALNPAAWTRIPNTLFSTKVSISKINSTDGVNTAKRTYGNFESFNISIPLNKGNGWVLDLALKNYSSVNYDTKFPGSIGGEDFIQSYSGNGGIERISAGFSYIILRYFSFGAQFNYAYGNIVKTTQINFANPDLQDVKNTLSNEIRGMYVNTGLIFHGLGRMLKSKELDKITIGVVFSTPMKMNSTIIGTFLKSTGTDSVGITEGTLDLPWALGFGISNEFNNKLTVAADVYMQNWDNYKYYGTHPAEIKNNLRAGLGIEYTPSKKFADPYYKKVSYRLGANYTADYITLGGEKINAYSINGGISLPIGSHNSLDLSLSYSTRGKKTNGLIKDDYVKFNASLNIGELWFLKPSDDY